jgi:hypothetical protein
MLPRYSNWLFDDQQVNPAFKVMSKELEKPVLLNGWGQTGSRLSAIGYISIWAFAYLEFEVLRFMTLLSSLGLVVSFVGLAWKPRKPAVLGVALGLIGSLHLPTLFTYLWLHG